MPDPEPGLSADTCRAARALLRWSVADLVREASVSPNSIQKVESGDTVRQATVGRILGAFQRNGVETLRCGAQRRC